MMTSVLLNALPRAAKRAPASAWRVVMNAKKQFSHAGWLVYGPDDSSYPVNQITLELINKVEFSRVFSP